MVFRESCVKWERGFVVSVESSNTGRLRLSDCFLLRVSEDQSKGLAGPTDLESSLIRLGGGHDQ